MNESHVVLVGGAPGSGKTTLARALAAELGWAWLSGDDIAVAARAMASAAERPELHPAHPHGHVGYFSDTPVATLIEDSLLLAAALWPAFRSVIQSHTADTAVVIDWWLFSPERVAAQALPGVSSVWLHIDPDALWHRERANVEFTAPAPDPERMLSNFMDRSLWRNDLVRDEATEAALPLLHQTGDRDVTQLVAMARTALTASGFSDGSRRAGSP